VENEDGELRTPEYRDIAVLTRTRDFGRELLQTADEFGFPMAYEGGIELFRTDPAKLLLAWFRILDDDLDRGWAVVLEEAGYTLDEIKHILEQGPYPEGMVEFRDEIGELETLGAVARRVFARYGYDGPTADVILHTIQSVHDATTMTRGDLIRFIERSIEDGATHEVSASAGDNSVTVQTIHSAKGLEYPIVVLGNMNSGRFPPNGGSGGTISYQDPVGLRRRKVYADDAHGLPHVYDTWRSDILRKCLPRNYDEVRRLLYVAITRAESHVVFTSGEEPNTFLQELPVDVEPIVPDPQEASVETTTQAQLQIDTPTREGPTGYTPHTLMQDSVFEDVEDGRGVEFGTKVHDFAEAYALGEDVHPDGDDEENVQCFLDSLDGELLVEEEAFLPITVDGERVTVSGIVDVVHVTSDKVEIVDYKTDRGRHAEAEYRKQLSVYYQVATAQYPDRAVSASIFYTASGVRQTIDPLSMESLKGEIRETRPEQSATDTEH